MFLVSVCFPLGAGWRVGGVGAEKSLPQSHGLCWWEVKLRGLPRPRPETFVSSEVPGERLALVSSSATWAGLSLAGSLASCLLSWPTEGSVSCFLRRFLDWRIAWMLEACASRKVDGVDPFLLTGCGVTALASRFCSHTSEASSLWPGFHQWARSCQETRLGRFRAAETGK